MKSLRGDDSAMQGVGSTIRVILFTLALDVLLLPVPGRCQQVPPFFRSVDDYIAAMETANRAQWQKPDQVVAALSIKSGESVADVGAGSGYFTVLFSRKVGDSGKVYAVDIEKGMLDHIAKRAQAEKLNNIQLVLSTPSDPLLPESSVDVVFLCNTYMYIGQRGDYLRLLAKALRKGGRLAIIDFKTENTLVGPPLAGRVSRETVLKEVLSATGFTLESEHQFLPHQYFLVFKKA